MTACKADAILVLIASAKLFNFKSLQPLPSPTDNYLPLLKADTLFTHVKGGVC